MWFFAFSFLVYIDENGDAGGNYTILGIKSMNNDKTNHSAYGMFPYGTFITRTNHNESIGSNSIPVCNVNILTLMLNEWVTSVWMSMGIWDFYTFIYDGIKFNGILSMEKQLKSCLIVEKFWKFLILMNIQLKTKLFTWKLFHSANKLYKL